MFNLISVSGCIDKSFEEKNTIKKRELVARSKMKIPVLKFEDNVVLQSSKERNDAMLNIWMQLIIESQLLTDAL